MIKTIPSPSRTGHGRSCPQCASIVERMQRNWFDRLLSLWLPVLRYRCRSDTCGWEGVLLRRQHAAPAEKAVPAAHRPRPGVLGRARMK